MDLRIRRATADDAPQMSRCVQAAYQHYIERMGKSPGPMLYDYEQVVAGPHAYVAQLGDKVVGVLVLEADPQNILLDNVAVDPGHQGLGLGRQLVAYAEATARRLGYAHIDLYTHEVMTENLALYQRLGYHETARKTVSGYDRIYMRKSLSD